MKENMKRLTRKALSVLARSPGTRYTHAFRTLLLRNRLREEAFVSGLRAASSLFPLISTSFSRLYLSPAPVRRDGQTKG